MLKKSISIILVIITIFSTVAITSSAANYTTGTYTPTSSSGINVRPEPNSSSRLGAASYGSKFEITRISGDWGYSPSIYCANGKTVSGWVHLGYCKKVSQHSHNYNGGRYYESAHPHAISVRCTSYDSCGGWKWTGEYHKVSGCSQCYPSATYYTLTYNANGGSNAPASQCQKKGETFSLNTSKPSRSGYTFLGWSTDKNATSAKFNPGHRVSLNGNATLYAVWKKNSTVKDVSYYVEVTANSGLTLRSGASTSYSALTALPKGTVVKVTQENNGWGKTTYNGKTGWISLNYTKKVNYDSSVKVNLDVKLFKQGDSRWSGVYIGNKTIGSVGCLTTAIAMVYSYNTNTTVYPDAMRRKLSYSNNDLYWSSLSKVGLSSTTYNSNLSNSMMKTIYSKLKAGRPVIIGASTNGGSYQHWVVITGYKGSSTTTFSSSDFLINDPGSQGCTTLSAFLANGNKSDRTKIIRIVY